MRRQILCILCSHFKRNKIKVQAKQPSPFLTDLEKMSFRFIVIPQIIKVEHFEYLSTYQNYSEGTWPLEQKLSQLQEKNFFENQRIGNRMYQFELLFCGEKNEKTVYYNLGKNTEQWVKLSALSVGRPGGQERYLLLKFNFIVENI